MCLDFALSQSCEYALSSGGHLLLYFEHAGVLIIDEIFILRHGRIIFRLCASLVCPNGCLRRYEVVHTDFHMPELYLWVDGHTAAFPKRSQQSPFD